MLKTLGVLPSNEKILPQPIEPKEDSALYTHYSISMHEVVVNVVAIAVSTVMRMFRILLQRVLSFIVF